MDELLNNAEQPEETPQPPFNTNDAGRAANAGTPDGMNSAYSGMPASKDESDDAMAQAMIDESESDEHMPADHTSVEMPTVQRADFGDLDTGGNYQPTGGNIDLLLDVNLPVAIELGRTLMTIKDILELGSGSIVELDKLAGEPVDILVNSRPLAKGEVVVLDEHFGVRITSLVSPRERLENLGA